jgi:hypothetical protein
LGRFLRSGIFVPNPSQNRVNLFRPIQTRYFPTDFARISLKKQICPKTVGNIETDFGRPIFDGFYFIFNWEIVFISRLCCKIFPLSPISFLTLKSISQKVLFKHQFQISSISSYFQSFSINFSTFLHQIRRDLLILKQFPHRPHRVMFGHRIKSL